MKVNLSAPRAADAVQLTALRQRPPDPNLSDKKELREAFRSFVGETLFGQMLKAMRRTVGEAAYFHGGRAEDVFTGQLDQLLAEKMSDAWADQLAGPMFELFTTNRKL